MAISKGVGGSGLFRMVLSETECWRVFRGGFKETVSELPCLVS